MATLNKCQFIGRLGRDPEMRYLPSGQPVANFSIGVDESYKDKQGQKVEAVEWINCVAWGKTAEFVSNYLAKGRLVYVEGKWKTEKFKDKDGNDRTAVKLNIQIIQGLDKKPEGAGAPASQGQYQRGGYSGQDDDLGPAFPSEASGMDDAPF